MLRKYCSIVLPYRCSWNLQWRYCYWYRKISAKKWLACDVNELGNPRQWQWSNDRKRVASDATHWPSGPWVGRAWGRVRAVPRSQYVFLIILLAIPWIPISNTSTERASVWRLSLETEVSFTIFSPASRVRVVHYIFTNISPATVKHARPNRQCVHPDIGICFYVLSGPWRCTLYRIFNLYSCRVSKRN